MAARRNLQKEQEALDWVRIPENFKRLNPSLQGVISHVLRNPDGEDPWGEAIENHNKFAKDNPIFRSTLFNQILSSKKTQDSRKSSSGKHKRLKPAFSDCHLIIRLKKQTMPGYLAFTVVRRTDPNSQERMEFEESNQAKIFLSLSSITGLFEEKKGCWIHLTNAEYFCEDSQAAVKAAMRQASL